MVKIAKGGNLVISYALLSRLIYPHQACTGRRGVGWGGGGGQVDPFLRS